MGGGIDALGEPLAITTSCSTSSRGHPRGPAQAVLGRPAGADNGDGAGVALSELAAVEKQRRQVADQAQICRVVRVEDRDQARTRFPGRGQLLVDTGTGVVQAHGHGLPQQGPVPGRGTRVLAQLTVHERGQALRALGAAGEQAPGEGGIAGAGVCPHQGSPQCRPRQQGHAPLAPQATSLPTPGRARLFGTSARPASAPGCSLPEWPGAASL
ncbi:hypothetical protein WKI67_00770 [Streptomyces sp. MS2.AVA.5]|uniref:Uncharacterized protein n=1 Tax=Streptomyces achmelvichensis TaxID=3134111 RepID=A0ACC6PL48_9ACTN